MCRCREIFFPDSSSNLDFPAISSFGLGGRINACNSGTVSSTPKSIEQCSLIVVCYFLGEEQRSCAGRGGAQRKFLCVNKHKKTGARNLASLYISVICYSCPKNDRTSALHGLFGQTGSAWWMPCFGHQLLCIFKFVLKILQRVQSLGRLLRRLFCQ